MALRESFNEVNIEGFLNKNNLEVRDTDKGKIISGTFEVRTDETNIIEVNVYSNELKQDGTENKIYKGLLTVMNDYVSADKVEGGYENADKVRIERGQVRINEFVGKDGEVHSSVRYNTNFVTRVTDDTYKTKANFKVEMIVRALRAETKNGEETGRGFIDGYFVDFKGNLQPLTIAVGKKIWAKAEDIIERNETYFFWGEIVSNVITNKVTIEADLGEDEERVFERVIKERLLKGAKLNEENGYDSKEIKQAQKDKAKFYEELKSKDKLTSGTKNNNKKSKKDEDDDLENMLDED